VAYLAIPTKVRLSWSAPSRAFALRLQYSSGNVFDNRFDVFGANFELAISRRIGVFGRYGYGSYDDTALATLTLTTGWRVLHSGTFAARWFGVAAGQLLLIMQGNRTQTNMEAFYNFPLATTFRSHL